MMTKLVSDVLMQTIEILNIYIFPTNLELQLTDSKIIK